MRRLISAYRLTSSLRVSGVASVVAPSNPLGRVGSAVAVTAVLVGVQLGLVAGHAGSALCRLAGGACSLPQSVAGGRVLENPAAGPAASVHRSVPAPGSPSRAHSALSFQTVAFRTQAPARGGQSLQPRADKSADPGSSAVPEKRRAARNAATSRQHAANRVNHGPKTTYAAAGLKSHLARHRRIDVHVSAYS